jgi:tetrahydromethanopterin S-methyltransferase subunit C
MTIDDRRQRHAEDDLTTLLSHAARQFRHLARDEFRVVHAELAANRRPVTVGGGLLGGAAVLAFVAVEASAAAAVAALSEVMPTWAAALLTGAAAGSAGSVLALLGKKQMERAVPAVQESVDSVKADLAAIKEGGQ